MIRRLVLAFSALMLLAGLGTASAASAMAAGSQGRTVHAAHTVHAAPMVRAKAPAAARPAAQPGARRVTPAVSAAVCDDSGTGLCLNRSGCGTTTVISFAHDFDSCEDFKPVQLSSMCGSGLVTSTCPFTVGSGLNNRYLNAIIVVWKSTATGLCVDTDNNGGGSLGTCPGLDGQGGATGTTFVWNGSHYVVSRFWSNFNFSLGAANTPAWMCSRGAPVQITVDSGSGNAGTCQWQYTNT